MEAGPEEEGQWRWWTSLRVPGCCGIRWPCCTAPWRGSSVWFLTLARRISLMPTPDRYGWNCEGGTTVCKLQRWVLNSFLVLVFYLSWLLWNCGWAWIKKKAFLTRHHLSLYFSSLVLFCYQCASRITPQSCLFSHSIFFLVVCEGSCKPGAATRTFLSWCPPLRVLRSQRAVHGQSD